MNFDWRNFEEIFDLLCNPGCKVHIRGLVVPGHFLAQNRPEESNSYLSDLLEGYLIEDVDENYSRKHLNGSQDHQPDQVGQRILFNCIYHLFVSGIVTGFFWGYGRENVESLGYFYFLKS